MATFDLDATRAFLNIIAPGEEQFTFQTFADADDASGSLVRMLHGTLDQHAAQLQRLNDQGAGVFVTVNETDLTGRKVNRTGFAGGSNFQIGWSHDEQNDEQVFP